MSKATWKDIRQALAQKNMLINMLLGFSAGVPLLLTSKTLQAWLAYGGATNVLVGVAATIGLPYTFKFLWAPLLDRYQLPFLGRRRGWLILMQVLIFAAIAFLSMTDPVANIERTFVMAFVIVLFAATQDTLVDAFRRESLTDDEQGLGASVYQMGYRIAMWLTGGVTLILAGIISWNMAYLIMSALMVVGIAATLWADEPKASARIPSTLSEAVIAPLKDFFSRNGAILFLLFILLYKVGDAMAGNMLSKFYADMQFTPQEVGVIAKTMGPIALIIGTLIGGGLIVRLGTQRSLFIFGIFQALSTLSFVLLSYSGHSLPMLTGVVFFEDFSAGMGNAAFMALMAALTNRAFTATQFALLTSLSTVPRTIIASFTGYLVNALGWAGFFTLCALVAIPGLVLLVYMNASKKIHFGVGQAK